MVSQCGAVVHDIATYLTFYLPLVVPTVKITHNNHIIMQELLGKPRHSRSTQQPTMTCHIMTCPVANVTGHMTCPVANVT